MSRLTIFTDKLPGNSEGDSLRTTSLSPVEKVFTFPILCGSALIAVVENIWVSIKKRMNRRRPDRPDALLKLCTASHLSALKVLRYQCPPIRSFAYQGCF